MVVHLVHRLAKYTMRPAKVKILLNVTLTIARTRRLGGDNKKESSPNELCSCSGVQVADGAPEGGVCTAAAGRGFSQLRHARRRRQHRGGTNSWHLANDLLGNEPPAARVARL